MKLHNIIWSFSGLGLPVVIAFISFPFLIDNLGAETFGLLSLGWVLIGYLGLFDFGVGRSVTRKIAEYKTNKPEYIEPIVNVGFHQCIRYSLMGVMVTSILFFFDLNDLLNVENISNLSLKISLLIVVISIPFQVLSAMYRGVNEAFEDFKYVAFVRKISAALNFLLPLALSFHWTRIDVMLLTLLLAKVLSCFMLLRSAQKKLKLYNAESNSNSSLPLMDTVKHDLKDFSKWSSVSAIISPLLVQSDRFLIAILISSSAVTTYVVPFEAITKTLIIVTGLTSVLFPFLTKEVVDNKHKAYGKFTNLVFILAVSLFVLYSLLFYFLPFLLDAWLINDLPKEALHIGKVLCIAVYVNSIGALFFSWIHANGDARFTGILHLSEFPIYIITLVVLIEYFGTVGAAYAWLLRVCADTSILIWRAKN